MIRKSGILIGSILSPCLLLGCAGIGSEPTWKGDRELAQLHATSCFAGEQHAGGDPRGTSHPNDRIYLASAADSLPVLARSPSNGTSDGSGGYSESHGSGGGGDWPLWLIPAGIAVIGGVAAIMTPDLADFLAEQGPQLPPTFTMNSLVITGLVQGNWPVVLDFQAAQGTSLLTEVCTTDDEPYRYRIDVTETGRKWQFFTLPAQFGDKPKPGAIKILAEGKSRNESEKQVPFQMIGLGAGPRAKGSVTIDQLEFRLLENQKNAFYRYFAHQPFNTVSPEILRYKREAEGIGVERVWWRDQEHLIQGISLGLQQPAQWDCKEAHPWPDQPGKLSIGPHLLQVRGWFGPKDTDKSWVAAWSENVVVVPKEWDLTPK